MRHILLKKRQRKDIITEYSEFLDVAHKNVCDHALFFDLYQTAFLLKLNTQQLMTGMIKGFYNGREVTAKG